MRRSIVFLVLTMLMMFVAKGHAAPGQIDTRFGTGGMAIAVPTVNGSARFITTDGAGKIFATGSASSIAATPVVDTRKHELIVRWQSDGTPDPTFNGTGLYQAPLSPDDIFSVNAIRDHEGMGLFFLDANRWLAIRAQDYYCLAPAACSGHQPRIAGRVIYDHGGTDPDFWSPEMGFGAPDRTQLIFDRADGVVIVGSGNDNLYGAGKTSLAKVRIDGTTDVSFNAAIRADYRLGCQSLTTLGTDRRSRGKALRLPNGKVLLAQGIEVNPPYPFDSQPASANPHRLCLSRFQPDGQRDTSFADQGDRVFDSLPFSSARIEPVGLFAQPGGGHVLLLQRTLSPEMGSTKGYTLVWLNEEGLLDIRYGNNLGYSNLNVVPVAVITAVTMQTDGYLLLAGYAPVNASSPVQEIDYNRPLLMRLHPQGGIDLTFGPTGGRSTDLIVQGKRLHPNAIHVAADGGIFVAGAAADGALTSGITTQFAVMKLQGNPPTAQQPAASTGAGTGGGGGCGITRDARFDPTWLAMLLLAASMLWQHRSAKQKNRM